MYDTLRRLPRGNVMEVPLGIRDGSGEHGKLDGWALYYQTVHGQPQMGGFVARLSSRLRASYESDPIVGPILNLSEGSPVGSSPMPCRDSLVCSVRYVVINRATASSELQAFVDEAFSLKIIERSQDRTLYAADRVKSCSCAR